MEDNSRKSVMEMSVMLESDHLVDGSVTAEELFERADKNHDGVLNKEEFVRVHQAMVTHAKEEMKRETEHRHSVQDLTQKEHVATRRAAAFKGGGTEGIQAARSHRLDPHVPRHTIVCRRWRCVMSM